MSSDYSLKCHKTDRDCYFEDKKYETNINGNITNPVNNPINYPSYNPVLQNNNLMVYTVMTPVVFSSRKLDIQHGTSFKS